MSQGGFERRGRAHEGYRFSERAARRIGLCCLLAGALTTIGCAPEIRGSDAEGRDGFPPSLDSLVALDPKPAARFSRAGIEPSPPLRASLLGFGSPSRTVLRARLSSELEKELEAVPESVGLHAKGIYRALDGDLGAAILHLSGAVLQDPARADLWNDLAVVHLRRHEESGNVRDLFGALRSSRRALSLDATNPAAAFNLAETLTRLSLVHQGPAAWDRFLEIEPEGEWAERARERRHSLTDASDEERWERAKRTVLAEWQRRGTVSAERVGEFPQRFREWVLKEVLPGWARAQNRGQTRHAAQRLGLARSIGDRLVGATEDHLVADAVAGIDRIVGEGDLVAVGEVSTAVIALSRGLLRFERQEYAAMRRDLALAEGVLRPLDNPLWGIGAYYRAAVASHADPATTVGGLLEVTGSLPIHRYPQLRGYCELMIGSVEAATGDAERGREQFDLARRLLDRSAPDVAERIVRPFLGDALRLLGRNDEALAVYAEGVTKSAYSGHPRHYGVALYTLTELLIEEEDGEAALPVAEEMVENAAGSGLPSLLAEAHLQRGRARHALGVPEDAAADLAEAERWAEQIPGADQRAWIASAIDLATAQVLSTREPEEALRRLNRLLEARLERGYLYRLPIVLLERSRAYGALGRDDLREGDLVVALDESDRLREEAKEPGNRRFAFAQAREIVDAMVAFQLDRRQDPEAAFEYAELGRARELSQALGLQATTPDDERTRPYRLDELQSQVPEGVAILEYAVLSDRLLVWTIHRGETDLRVERIGREEVANRVKAFLGALDRRAGSGVVRPAAAELFDLLVADSLATIPPDAALVFVPDRSLGDLPFGALYDRSSARYLIETRPVAVAPSARTYAAAIERAARTRDTPASVLAVGEPHFSVKLFPRLPRLGRAADEAREAGGAFPAAVVLTGEDATKAAVIKELSRHPVAYFATHAVVDPAVPERSALVLAGDDEQGSLLTTEEIRRLDLHGVRLAVLPVCDAIQGKEHGEEGLTGLVAAFLEAGVSAVVAPTRPVSDDGTVWLLDFVRAVAAGEEVGSAFQRAQVNAIGTLHESEWSTFQLIGATGKEP